MSRITKHSFLVEVDVGSGDPSRVRLRESPAVSGADLTFLVTVVDVLTGEVYQSVLAMVSVPGDPLETYRYLPPGSHEPRTTPLRAFSAPATRRKPVAQHKLVVTIDPQTGEPPWSFSIRRSPDDVISAVTVTIFDETTGIRYGPDVLTPPTPDPVPDPDPEEPEPPSHTIVLLAGGGQTAEQGSELDTISVEVRDTATGDPIPAEPVTWTPLDGGSVIGDSPTDGSGQATAAWTLADAPGTQRLQITTAAGSLLVTAVSTATPPPPPPTPPPSGYTLAATQGDGQTGQVSTKLPIRIVVHVTNDATGQAAVDFPVTFTPSGNGTLSGVQSISGDGGNVFADWTLGSTPGAQTLVITGPNGESVQVSATATAAPPAPPPPPPPPPSGSNLTPAALFPLLGPLTAVGSTSPFSAYDARFLGTATPNNELRHFQEYLANENAPSTPYVYHNHYGSLVQRLCWSIRKGLPFGPTATDEATNMYARGKRILRRYLQWSKANNYGIPPHNNTGMIGIECLYVLEGDIEAKNHLHIAALSGLHDQFNYLKFLSSGSDARQVAVALQGFSACYRLNIPYTGNAANPQFPTVSAVTSWRGAAERQMGWIEDWILADGTIRSPAHSNAEAYLFNAMLAQTLFRYHATVDNTGRALALAVKIMNHLLVKWTAFKAAHPTFECLPYTSNDNGESPDLAGMFATPCAIAYQETADAGFITMAASHISAARRAYVTGVKQWNQAYSEAVPMAAEAILAGEPWGG